jgi:hypothetical protein
VKLRKPWRTRFTFLISRLTASVGPLEPPLVACQARISASHARLVTRNPVDLGNLTVESEDRHRDGVPVDVQAEVGRAKLRETNKAGSFLCGSVRAVVDDPRTCSPRTEPAALC